MSVVLMPKQYAPQGAFENETPEEAAARLHAKKNKPVNPVEDMDFPAYRYRPYPRAVYRKWNEDDRENEIYKVAGKNMLNLEQKRDRFTAEALVGTFETRLVGAVDYTPLDRGDEVNSTLRERNDKEFAALIDEGWAETPDGVKAATTRMQIRKATAAAERIHDDRHLGEQAAAELDVIDSAADDHVINVAETRKQLQAEGKLPKEKK